MQEKLFITLQKFLFLFGELLILFVGISFAVGLLQIYISKDKIRRLLTTRYGVLNGVFGAAIGAVTPFCSCSTVPILVGLIKSNAPFSGIVSFLLASPILNPAIIGLFLTFFGLKAAALYFCFTFLFAVTLGLLLDKLGFGREVKNVTIRGGARDEVTYETLTGTFLERNRKAVVHALSDSVFFFRRVFLFLLLGAAIGAAIYGFIPAELFSRFAGSDSIFAVPVAAILGIPMYIRTETMIPIAGVLVDKGAGYGTVIALIIGGAGISIPEVSLLSSIFKRKMMIAFIVSVFTVAVSIGYIFNMII